MADILVTSTLFPDGTIVGAYDATGYSNFPSSSGPLGTAVDTSEQKKGSVKLEGLTNNKAYFAAAKVSGVWKGVRFIANAEDPPAWHTVGPPGADGATIRSGDGAPSNGLGLNGDFYVDLENARFYGPKEGSAWSGEFIQINAGPKGAKGDTGSTGATGAKGSTGATGSTGAQGPAGRDGEDGSIGATGPPGPTGGKGDAGAAGAAGAKGAEGAQGVKGEKGDKGDTGAAGAKGRTILSGEGNPDDELGEEGDFYLRLDGYFLWGPKGEDEWPDGPAPLEGPIGATGAKGDKGDSGALLSGSIGGNGSISEGAGFTVETEGTGNYRIIANSALPTAGFMSVQCVEAGFISHAEEFSGKTEWLVSLQKLVAGAFAAANGKFTFAVRPLTK